MPDVPWENIEKKIRRDCQKQKDPERAQQFNIIKGRILFDYIRKNNVLFREFPMPFGPTLPDDKNIKFWHDRIGIKSGVAFSLFLDFRSQSGIDSSITRKIVFSIQKAFVLSQDPDLDSVLPCIINILGSKKKGFYLEEHIYEGNDFLDITEINNLLLSVYDDWLRILDEVSAPVKKTGTDDRNYRLF